VASEALKTWLRNHCQALLHRATSNIADQKSLLPL
jgi:hypothetical protein